MDATEQLAQDWEVGWHLKRVIYAVANQENQASIRVMQRLGMAPVGRTQKYYGGETKLFELRAFPFN